MDSGAGFPTASAQQLEEKSRWSEKRRRKNRHCDLRQRLDRRGPRPPPRVSPKSQMPPPRPETIVLLAAQRLTCWGLRQPPSRIRRRPPLLSRRFGTIVLLLATHLVRLPSPPQRSCPVDLQRPPCLIHRSRLSEPPLRHQPPQSTSSGSCCGSGWVSACSECLCSSELHGKRCGSDAILC
jgi:hypothetical protein